MSEHTSFFPVFVNLEERRVVVVGGGDVAERKVRDLLNCAARVNVIAPEVTPALASMVAEGAITHEARAYHTGDLDGAAIAFVAVDDPETSAQAARDARAARVQVNVVDCPAMCDFLVPSVLRRGRLAVAISTSGASPAWARKLRKQLEATIGPEWEQLMDALASVRETLMHEMPDPAERRAALLRLADDKCLELAREQGGEDLAEALLTFAREGTSKG